MVCLLLNRSIEARYISSLFLLALKLAKKKQTRQIIYSPFIVNNKIAKIILLETTRSVFVCLKKSKECCAEVRACL